MKVRKRKKRKAAIRKAAKKRRVKKAKKALSKRRRKKKLAVSEHVKPAVEEPKDYGFDDEPGIAEIDREADTATFDEIGGDPGEPEDVNDEYEDEGYF